MNYDEDGWRIAVDVARLAPLTGSCSLRSRTVLGVNAELDRLRAEVEALRADAGRYRWLRANQENLTDPELDAVIDAAIAKTEGGSNG